MAWGRKHTAAQKPAWSQDDYHTAFASKINEQIEQGIAPWQKPWKPGERRLPENVASKKPYRGGNAVYLSVTQTAKGYSDNRWATYKQIKDMGGQVRKGEKATQVLFYKFDDERKEQQPGAVDTPATSPDGAVEKERPRSPMVRCYAVWLCCNFRAATSGWTTFGKHRTGSPIMPSDNPFKWRQFEPALILQCVRWYLRYALSYRDLEDMMRERGLCVDHTTIYRWVQRYAPEIDKRCRPFLRRTNDSYRIDETYVRVAGAWTYLYRGVDSNGDTLDFLLRATRDRKAAIAFFRKTLGAAHTTPPRVVTVDKNPAYPVAFEAVRHEGLVRPRSNLRQCKYLNNIIEQDHRFIKRRARPMLGFKRFTTAWRTLRGIEIMHALRKGQARWMAKGDVVGQTQLIHKVFGLAA